MNTLDALKSRTSYRGRYRQEPVCREHLTAIMEAGLAAPSGCNMQTTSLIAVDDPPTLKRLFELIVPPVVDQPPAMICVLTQKKIAYRNKSFHVQDYAAAIENMLLAIVALGYQSCWLEGHITDEDAIGRRMADVLHVPADYELVCCLPIGIAAEAVRRPEKAPFEQRAWFNRFMG